MGDHESTAADITGGRVDHGEGELGGDGGVNSVAALLQDGYTDGTGERVGGYDGAVGDFDFSLDGV
jgi:hypothetical protein